MPVYTRSNLTDNLWKVGEIWIPNKEEKNGNWTSVSGFGVGVYDIKVIENKEKNIYQVVFYTLGNYKALVGECSYKDAYDEKLKSENVPFYFEILNDDYEIDQEKTQEIFNKLPSELKKLMSKFNDKYVNNQLKEKENIR